MIMMIAQLCGNRKRGNDNNRLMKTVEDAPSKYNIDLFSSERINHKHNAKVKMMKYTGARFDRTKLPISYIP